MSGWCLAGDFDLIAAERLSCFADPLTNLGDGPVVAAIHAAESKSDGAASAELAGICDGPRGVGKDLWAIEAIDDDGEFHFRGVFGFRADPSTIHVTFHAATSFFAEGEDSSRTSINA